MTPKQGARNVNFRVIKGASHWGSSSRRRWDTNTYHAGFGRGSIEEAVIQGEEEAYPCEGGLSRLLLAVWKGKNAESGPIRRTDRWLTGGSPFDDRSRCLEL